MRIVPSSTRILYIVPRTGVFTTHTKLNRGLRLQRGPELDGDLERELHQNRAHLDAPVSPVPVVRNKMPMGGQSPSGCAAEMAEMAAPGATGGGGGAPAVDPEAWRALGNDTEAGRLLAKLYGGSRKVKIAYPPVRARAGAGGARRAFVPAGGAAGVDAREARLAHVPIHVPAVGRGEARHYAPIELQQGGKKLKEVRQRRVAVAAAFAGEAVGVSLSASRVFAGSPRCG